MVLHPLSSNDLYRLIELEPAYEAWRFSYAMDEYVEEILVRNRGYLTKDPTSAKSDRTTGAPIQ